MLGQLNNLGNFYVGLAEHRNNSRASPRFSLMTSHGKSSKNLRKANGLPRMPSARLRPLFLLRDDAHEKRRVQRARTAQRANLGGR
ncbi:hypothetical protein DMN91_006905 [Ooceraea biroi]|uniref:Uncharacterized protein n=1 Tax=Ooceraea biroi TaxID=2015173 RepID=A0A3L8DKD3_OOCBI|nr:hypothetical protein DMN91_006905 [Ooceraea biroi]